ncbi:MAG: hypothetical protein DRR06_20800 [Gammaproteobacteria bacterium]|nr:MAG: hypothetical protein DRR06_20800 [Gammaproteobacteria bacterium]
MSITIKGIMDLRDEMVGKLGWHNDMVLVVSADGGINELIEMARAENVPHHHISETENNRRALNVYGMDVRESATMERGKFLIMTEDAFKMMERFPIKHFTSADELRSGIDNAMRSMNKPKIQ